jgi:hypothetical protein
MNITEIVNNSTRDMTYSEYIEDTNWIKMFGIVLISIFSIFTLLACIRIRNKY